MPISCVYDKSTRFYHPELSNIYGDSSTTIGRRTAVGPFVEIQSAVTIGDDCAIQSHSFICSNVHIGNHVFVGHGVMFTNDKNPESHNKDWECLPTIVEDDVSIGSGATILPVRLGKGCRVGAGAVVTKDVPPRMTVVGNPARPLLGCHLVVGLGETGQPLYNLLSKAHTVYGLDPGKGIQLPDSVKRVSFLHVCIPGSLENFLDIIRELINKYFPAYVIVHSTVPVGTTSRIENPYGLVFHSPITGKHKRMEEDLQRHTKFLGGAVDDPVVHGIFNKAGIKTRYLGSSDTTELGKMLATTLYGYLIAWEQEVDRICTLFGVNREQARRLWTEINSNDWDPSVKYPGVILGHCVLPNIDILLSQVDSDMLKWIVKSNTSYQERS